MRRADRVAGVSPDLDDPDAAAGARPSGKPRQALVRVGRAMAWALLPLLAMVVAGIGYGLGRGNLTLREALADRLPSEIATWLPRGASGVEIRDYAFELAEPEAKVGASVLTVRLVHRPTGKPISDAVVFARRLDMSPEGMSTMTAGLEPLAAPDPGLYRFATKLTMEGGWQLSLAAKVQGETGTVETKLMLKAVP